MLISSNLYSRLMSTNEFTEPVAEPRGITVSCVPNAWCALVIPGDRAISDGVWYCIGRATVNTTVDIIG